MQTEERPTEVTPPRQPVPRRTMDGDRKCAVVAGVLFITAIAAGVLSKLLLGLVERPDYLSTIAGNQTRMALGALCIIVMSFAGAGVASRCIRSCVGMERAWRSVPSVSGSWKR